MNAAADPAPAARASAAPAAAETLAASVTVLLLLTVVQRGVGFVRGVLFCRWLEPAQLGLWDLTFGFLMLAGPISVLGLGGTYGRYLEHFRQRGQMRSFVRRTAACMALLAAASAGGLWLTRQTVAQWVYAQPDAAAIMALAAVGLLALVAFNWLFEFFGGLRQFRLASALQFAHSLAFAVLGVALAWCWEPSARSLTAALGGAYVLCVLGAIPYVRRTWRNLPHDAAALPQTALWAKLAPFAAWVWLTNWLANLFDLVDRWMLAHCAAPGVDALVEVGNYHAARVLPLPLLAIAALLRSALLPHLSHAWENGDRDATRRQLELAIKLWGLGLLAATTGLMLVAPTLFATVLHGKFSAGLGVLALTAVYLAWEGLAVVASTYLWCAERPGLGTLPLAAALACNVGLNLLLVPRWGLHGAVLATAAANGLMLVATLWLNARQGAPSGLGTWVVALAPAAVLVGPAAGCIVGIGLAHQAFSRNWLLTPPEKRQLAQAAQRLGHRLGWQ